MKLPEDGWFEKKCYNKEVVSFDIEQHQLTHDAHNQYLHTKDQT